MLRIASSLLLLAVAACATPRPTIIVPPGVTTTQYVPRPTPPAITDGPEIIVVTKDNVDEILSNNPVLVAMTPEQFKEMLENNQKVLVFIANQNKVIELYEKQIVSDK